MNMTTKCLERSFFVKTPNAIPKLTENISDVKTWHGLFHSNKPQKSGGFYGVSSDHQPFCFDALGSNTYYGRYLLAEIILVQRNGSYFMGGWIVAE
jgi:hypothetical protein